MSGFIPKEKMAVYQHWDAPDFDEEKSEPGQKDITASHSKIENVIIPKEKLTAYQRWELAAFDEAQSGAGVAKHGEVIVETVSLSSLNDAMSETENTGSANNEHEANVSEQSLIDAESEMATAIVLPTAAEIEQMHEEARQQGHEEGYKDGYAAGYEAAYGTGAAEIQEKTAHLTELSSKFDELLSGLDQSLKDIDQQVAEKLLATAVELASQMVRQSIKIKPELVLPVVREAMSVLNPVSGHGHPVLHIHPDDAQLIKEHLSDQLGHSSWKVMEDPSINPGGCRVELGSGEVDATMRTRWKRILESIGINQEWLDSKP